MSLEPHSGLAVAIVAGAASQPGRDVALGLAGWGWPIVVVYLEDQAEAEATVVAIIEGGSASVAVRADLLDDLDVQRLFAESISAFGVVNVLVVSTSDSAGPLYEHAARYLREGGLIVSMTGTAAPSPGLRSKLRKRSIVVGRVPPGAVLAFLERWRQQNHN